MLGFRVPDADEALLISGGKPGKDGTPFKVVVGRRAFVPPIMKKAQTISFAMNRCLIEENCYTREKIEVSVRAVAAFKVGEDPESIVNAAYRFLSDQKRMPELTGQIFAGHLREIVGGMTLDEILTQRQVLANRVLDASKVELAPLGLAVDSFQIDTVSDLDQGVIAAMSAPHVAAIRRDAAIAQAAADQAAVEKQQASARNQADFARQTAVTQAGYEAEVKKAQAASNSDAEVARARADGEISEAAAASGQAGPLAQAAAQRAVAVAQTELAERTAELRQKQLLSEVIRPAEAEAERTRTLAKAEADATTLAAEAAASSDRVSIELKLIEQMPDIVGRGAEALRNANINLLDGADGLSRLVAGLVNQGVAIYNSTKSELAGGRGDDASSATTGERLAAGDRQ